MTTRMLIDARHPEETRVAVLKGNRIDEFDFDSADHKQIKGDIYLAKVTRVEPSLQAAFVDFGGNRHGFLAFSEIHPDYYQIPAEDRRALLAEEAAHAEEEAALRRLAEGEEDFLGDDELGESLADDLAGNDHDMGSVTEVDTSEMDDVSTIEAGHIDDRYDNDADFDGDRRFDSDEERASDDHNGSSPRRGRRQGSQDNARAKQADALRARRMALRRRYKIQDVIHRRQVLLVQAVKEERGNKGAALTTYLSLAGRYCVLMPNSSHGGGISRKISSIADRKRLKSVIAEMDLPKTMGCIVRTAGLQRTKTEIKRDFDYLARLWDDIRDTTLKSSAPALIHSDSDLIKRAIRDIYSREIEDVVVEGEAGYRDARDFMKLLMPSHARRVKHYADPVPLFQRYGAEDQLSALYDPVVQLKSGGYLVINPTEALVSIDINSGRSTKEHGIEATALNTNLEAAREIARQLRLRDMAGLVVIDFIDMEYGSNVRKVEKAMKDALKNDRARIQIGRISSFGLMEMSRQRLRTGMLEATTRSCPHCDGTGLVRTAASAGLSALRLIEDEAARGKGTIITLFTSQEASIYVLNAKRIDLAGIEDRYGVIVEVIPEGENEGAKMRVASSGPPNHFVPRFEAISLSEYDEDLDDNNNNDDDDDDDDDNEEVEISSSSSSSSGQSDDSQRKRRKRRRGRAHRDEHDTPEASPTNISDDAPIENEPIEADDAKDGEAPRKRRRRSRRRRDTRGDHAAHEGGANSTADEEEADVLHNGASEEAPLIMEVDLAALVETVTPAKPRRSRRKSTLDVPHEDAAVAPLASLEVEPSTNNTTPPPPELPRAPASSHTKAARKPAKRANKTEEPSTPPAEAVPTEILGAAPEPKAKRTRRKKVDAPNDDMPPAPVNPAPVDNIAATAEMTAQPEQGEQGEQGEQAENLAPRRGWWQNTFGG